MPLYYDDNQPQGPIETDNGTDGATNSDEASDVRRARKPR